MPTIRARCGSTGRPVHFASPRDARARRDRHGASGTVGGSRPERGGERAPRRATGAAVRTDRLASHAARRSGASGEPRHRRRSAHAHGRLCRLVCSSLSKWPGCCFPAPASSSWTNRLRRSHRRRSSGCSVCCVGCAMPAGASCSSRIFSTTCWRSATGSRCSAMARRWRPKRARASTNAGSSIG